MSVYFQSPEGQKGNSGLNVCPIFRGHLNSHPPPWRAMRDTHLRRIRTQGRYEWRKSSGCTRQSVAENAVSRYKAILGVSLSARTVKNQKVEAAIKCAVLNRMAELGMPRSERVY